MSLIYHTRIPAKLILFGEWAVLKKYPALGVALNKHFECTLEDNLSDGLLIESPECTFHWKKNVDLAPEFLKITQEALHFIFKNPLEVLNKKKLSLKRNWLLSEGLGSSSALFLSLIYLEQFLLFKKTTFSAKDLKSFQKKLIEFQKGGSGFDLLIQGCGGFLKFEDTSEKTSEISSFQRFGLSHFPPELLLVHTGKKEKTKEAIKKISSSNNPLHEKIYSEIGKSTENFLKHLNWELCIHEHFELLKMLGVVPDFVSALKDEWAQKKWITCLKTTGAGGGDTLMLWTRKEHQKELIENLETKGYWLENSHPASASQMEF